eukprot:scaffold1616_cov310-Pinguiococcus_pyrenoidosus.AAC.18
MLCANGLPHAKVPMIGWDLSAQVRTQQTSFRATVRKLHHRRPPPFGVMAKPHEALHSVGAFRCAASSTLETF